MGRATDTLIVTLGLSLLACGTPRETPDARVDVVDAQPPGCKLAAQARADGGCCPEGEIYAQGSGTCEGVGPPECAATIFSTPEDCHPRWCWDWLNEGGEPCGDGDALGCRLAGRACTAEEISLQKGCLAGEYPARRLGWACSPAGFGPWISKEQAPVGFDAQGLPGVPELPDLVTPRWCWDTEGDARAPCEPSAPGCNLLGRVCTDDERSTGAGCPAGERPTASVTGRTRICPG